MATSKGNGKSGSTGNKKKSTTKTTSRTTTSRTSSSGKNAKITEKRTPRNQETRTVKGRTVREAVPVKEPRVLTKEEESIRNEIILTITALVSVLIILSFFNICGVVGRGITNFLFGTIGAFSYAFPVVLFFFMAFFLSNHGNRIARQKILAALAFLFLLTALIQMICGLQPGMNVFDYYKFCSEHRTGGGVFGAVVAVPFTAAFGKVATYCIICAFMIVFLIILTGKAIFKLLKDKGEETVKITKEKLNERNKYFDEVEQEEIKNDLEHHSKLQYVTLNGNNPEDNKKKNKNESEEQKTSFIDTLQKLGSNNGQFPLSGDTTREQHIFSQDYLELQEHAEDLDPEGNVITKGSGKRTKNQPVIQPETEPVKPVTRPYTVKGNFKDDVPTDMKEITPNAEKPDTTDAAQPKEKPEKVKADPQLNIETAAEIDASLQIAAEVKKEYVFPPISLLTAGNGSSAAVSRREIDKNAETLTRTLESFGVHVKLLNVSCGPTVTRYELQPEQGVKVSSVTKLENDIKLNLAASDIRIEAPIPGKAAIGIEVPNKENSTVRVRDILESPEYKGQSSGIAFAVGKDITGNSIVTDIAKMPHLLIAGATGSGKSVCINTLIMSILYKYKPTDVRLIMIDPKMVELGVYNGIPHLLIPVVTDPKKAAASLNWAVLEMTNRYEKFAENHVRDLKGYNKCMEDLARKNPKEAKENPEAFAKLPQIVIVVDELADLMMVAPGEVENAIIRLSQLARAAGMHLVIATQRPSVNVITGLIKANMPSRIALAVTSGVDSRTILDQGGAEKLLGKGDMLFAPMNLPKPIRVQGAFVSDKEVEDVVDYLKKENSEAKYSDDITSKINSITVSTGKSVPQADTSSDGGSADGKDEYLVEAGRLIIDKQKASIGMLQRVYSIGFNRAARIMDQLADYGVVGMENGTKPREILMTKEQFEEYVRNNLS